MPKIFTPDSFIRRYKKFLNRHPELEKKVRDKLDELRRNPYAPALRFHKLTGSLDEFYAISIDYDNRIIIDADFKNDTFYLIGIGPHDDVY